MANKGAKQYLCLVCKVAFKRSETCVMCQVCEEYTHPTCSDISKDLLKYLVSESNEGNSISWSCTHCTKFAKVLNNKVKVMNKEIMDMKKTMTEMQDNHEDVVKVVKSEKEKCDKNEQKIAEGQ